MHSLWLFNWVILSRRIVALVYLERQQWDFYSFHLSTQGRYLISPLGFMQFGFERFSNVGELEFWLHVRPGRHMRWLHLPPPPHQVWKELHFWCCISVSNTAPAASVQSDTSNRHFEAKQSRTVSTTSSCPHERENVRFVHHKQRLRMCYIFCFFFFF